MKLKLWKSTNFQKLERIYASPYLRHCFETLSDAFGPLFVYGLSAGDNDSHIYEAIFDSGISHLNYCIHTPTANVEYVAGELARFKERMSSDVSIRSSIPRQRMCGDEDRASKEFRELILC